ncbi:endocuticle structural glycoprotein SgAbd-2-like [Anthonomus grandis grandis]|uniref:endocuticle structural glycoprotein SgAbd-2-like n=1 Tax=Anthonomus grandis grandis TaxID=2921223 RepID=UPI0021659A1C|nr:endocuticle structural glycoprotein SgAbd-2-like [Anthonomus grandis grandis]
MVGHILIIVALVSFSSAAQLTGREQVPIISQDIDVQFDGTFSHSYQTGNGISVNEQGRPKGAGKDGDIEEVQGTFQYTAPDGTPIQLQYIADENGFQPSGAHLPISPEAPPIPLAIQRALEWNARHPEEDKL